MAKRKLVFRKEQRQYVPDLKKEVVVSKAMSYYVANERDVQTPLGMIPKKELKKKSGSTVKTKQGKDFTLLDADFIDDFTRIKRGPQTMSLKDMGLIVSNTGINKNSVVVEAGTGSGALACYLAHLCKKVTSYDVEEKNVALGKENADFLGLKNLTVKKGSIYTKIPDKNTDLIVLDVPDPAKAINTAANSLRVGGFVVAYTLQATQLQQFANEIKKDKRFLFVKTSELIERQWKIDGNVLRPHNIPIGHTGFLTFARKIQ